MKTLALLMVLAISVGLLGPAEAAAGEFVPIPLDSVANYVPSGSDLLAPPRLSGDHDEIDGIPVHLVSLPRPGGRSQVAVGLSGNQPTAVRGISVGFSGVRNLHFFHAMLRGEAPSGSFLAKYVIRYSRGKIAEVPVVLGRSIGATSRAQATPEARAIQAVVDGKPRGSFVYHYIWRNPMPQETIASIDLIAVTPKVLMSLSCLTAELNPVQARGAAGQISLALLQQVGKVRRELRTHLEIAGIYLLRGSYPASANKSLQQAIRSGDAGLLECYQLLRALRAAAERGQGEPKEARAQIKALWARADAIQEILTKVARTQ